MRQQGILDVLGLSDLYQEAQADCQLIVDGQYSFELDIYLQVVSRRVSHIPPLCTLPRPALVCPHKALQITFDGATTLLKTYLPT